MRVIGQLVLFNSTDSLGDTFSPKCNFIVHDLNNLQVTNKYGEGYYGKVVRFDILENCAVVAVDIANEHSEFVKKAITEVGIRFGIMGTTLTPGNLIKEFKLTGVMLCGANCDAKIGQVEIFDEEVEDTIWVEKGDEVNLFANKFQLLLSELIEMEDKIGLKTTKELAPYLHYYWKRSNEGIKNASRRIHPTSTEEYSICAPPKENNERDICSNPDGELQVDQHNP